MTGIDMPRIAILMAVYKPRLDWLAEQLESLDVQTYPNLRLYIRDDCSPMVDFEETEALVKECIRSVPYEIRRNERNLGSNRTFELLTKEAEGEYFAYCDQDDIWLPEKLTDLYRKLTDSGAAVVCCDQAVIDGEGKTVADSITKVHRRHVYREGPGLAPYLMVRNFISGCAMLIRADIAREAMPFEYGYVYDQWIGIVAASLGSVVVIGRPLIYRRLHGGNQTCILAGVNSKQDYYKVRVEQALTRFEAASKRIRCAPKEQRQIERIRAAMTARLDYGRKPSICALRTFSKCDVLSRQMVLFEAVLPFMPKRIAKVVIRRIGRRQI